MRKLLFKIFPFDLELNQPVQQLIQRPRFQGSILPPFYEQILAPCSSFMRTLKRRPERGVQLFSAAGHIGPLLVYRGPNLCQIFKAKIMQPLQYGCCLLQL